MATFVSADWVSERIGRPGYLIIDPRSAMRYLMGHLRGAVNVPFKKLQGTDGRIGQPEQLAAAFGEAGLGDDVTPVLYDHQDGRNAAMAAWVLEYLGRNDVHVMDLLFEGWKEEGREVLYRPVPTVPGSFYASPQPVGAGYAERSGHRWRTEAPGYTHPGGVSRPDGDGPSPRAHSRRGQPPPLGYGRRRRKVAHRAGAVTTAAGEGRNHARRYGGGILPQWGPGFTGLPLYAAGRVRCPTLRRLLRRVDGQRSPSGNLTFHSFS